jgi:hypothetical protein
MYDVLTVVNVAVETMLTMKRMMTMMMMTASVVVVHR